MSSYKNLYPYGLPVSFIAVLYFNAVSPTGISFAPYILLLILYNVLFVNDKLQYVYAAVFIIGSGLSQYYKGTDTRHILMLFIPLTGFTFLFISVVKIMLHHQIKLNEQNEVLNEAKSSLDALIENTNSTIWCIDKNYSYLKGNLKFKKTLLSTFKSEVNAGDNLLEFAATDKDRAFWKNLYDRGLNGDAFITEAMFVEQGEAIYREHSINPMINAAGAIYGANIVSKDITKKKSFEKQRKDNEQLLLLIIEKMPVGFELFNENGLLIMMNEVQKQNLGLLDEASIGKFNVLADPFILHSGQLEHFEKAYKTGEIVTFDATVDFNIPQNTRSQKKGKAFFEVVLFSIQNETRGIIALTRDITSRKMSEETLKQQNKKMETYTFTLSHVIRRPIANLISLTNLLDNDASLNEEDKMTMKHINDSVTQLDEIIKDLNFSITSAN